MSHAEDCSKRLVLSGLAVDISLAVVSLLGKFVGDGITGSLGTGTESGVVVLGNVLVGLLRSSGTSTLDSLADVVCGVPE